MSVLPARTEAPPPFEGAVLVGGRSTRFGADKAARFGGVAEAALGEAGAIRVRRIGGRERPDDEPGLGPLSGIVTALAGARLPVVAVLACDLPLVTSDAVIAVVLGLGPDADVAVAVAGGRRHPLLAAYRVAALPHLRGALATGERAVHRALAGLRVAEVVLADEREATNVNTPADLAALSGLPTR